MPALGGWGVGDGGGPGTYPHICALRPQARVAPPKGGGGLADGCACSRARQWVAGGRASALTF
eukprot:1858590-Prymnesium_polylepis.1